MNDETTEERIARMRKPVIIFDEKIRIEQAEHSQGFSAGRDGTPREKSKSPVWQKGYDDGVLVRAEQERTS